MDRCEDVLPFPLRGFQITLISYRLEKSHRLMNEIASNPVMPHHKKMEATFSLLDVMRKLQNIDNTKAYKRESGQLYETIAKWEKFQNQSMVVGINHINMQLNQGPIIKDEVENVEVPEADNVGEDLNDHKDRISKVQRWVNNIESIPHFEDSLF